MKTCPCGIAAVDCEYHRPEPERGDALTAAWQSHYDETFRRIVEGLALWVPRKDLERLLKTIK